jgi:hypothetical protein
MATTNKGATMSVTFSLHINDSDLVGFELYDYETETSHHADSYEHGKELWKQLGADAQSWSLSAKYDIPHDRNVNMSNANAREVLSYLDLDSDDLCGSITPDDLAGRCLIALALAPDVELVPTEERGALGATIIDGGRAKGYIPSKLEALLALCDSARDHGRDIQWA